MIPTSQDKNNKKSDIKIKKVKAKDIKSAYNVHEETENPMMMPLAIYAR